MNRKDIQQAVRGIAWMLLAIFLAVVAVPMDLEGIFFISWIIMLCGFLKTWCAFGNKDETIEEIEEKRVWK